MARWEGANSNTYPQDIEVTGELIQSLVKLAHGLKRLGIQDIDGSLTYEGAIYAKSIQSRQSEFKNSKM